MVMSAGLIIYAVMVAIQGLLFLIGAALIVGSLVKNKGSNIYVTAFILWAISPVFSMVGVFFGVFL